MIWKVLGAAAAMAATAAARRVTASGWVAVTGKEPPGNPEDPELDWREAVAWAVISGAVIGVIQLVIARQTGALVARARATAPGLTSNRTTGR